jgi:DNA ligase 1
MTILFMLTLLCRWISEKLDGIRAFWDGTRLYNLRGFPFVAPINYRETFPEHPVEGELCVPGSKNPLQEVYDIVT